MVALSISKLRVGAEAYQLSGVAQTLDDYYTGAGEAEGQWVGTGTQALNLDGDVSADDLRSVLAGIAPDAGGLTPNGTNPIAHPRRVPGFDLTFKVPKSVSVLYAVSDDPRVQGAIVEAGYAAVEHVVGWLEREAVRVRRGSNSVPLTDKREALGGQRDGIRELETTGLVAASFRHRTSRAGDPFLHWHVLAANMAQGVDGKWSSIVHPHLYSHARAAGEVFQAVVRDELTRTLGLEWRPGRHVHEVVGVPDNIMRLFSKRRAEIDAYVAATGTPADGDDHEAAALATRRSKGEQETTVGLSERWRSESLDAGWGPADVDVLMQSTLPRSTTEFGAGLWKMPTTWFDENGTAHEGERTVDAEEWIADVLRRELTNESATFRPVDAVQAVAHRLGTGASVSTIERVTNRLLASAQVLPVGDEFTSRELHDTERRFVDTLTAKAELPGPNIEAVQHILAATPTLGNDQANAVSMTAASPNAVSVLIGPAGTGKTYTLNTMRTLFEQQGWTVHGTAPSARAAAELSSGAGITSATMHSLLRQLYDGTQHLGPTDLLIVDEAGMADIRTLETLTTTAVRGGARVLLVGDHRQLPEVGAGGGFAYAAQHADSITELAVNRRQKQPWEQHALTALRDGDINQAVNAYVDHHRVVVTKDGPSMIERATTAWFEATQSGIDLALIAGTNDMVDQLNNAILGRLTSPGEPLAQADKGTFAGTHWHVGERIVIRRNYHDQLDRSVNVRNGQAGTVTAIPTGHGQSLTVLLDDRDTPITLDQRFLDANGRLSIGYASTIHRTQGGTWDAAITVGLDGLYREGAYTALSRGRHENLIILTDPEARQLAAEQAQDPPRHDRGLRLPTEEPGTPTAELTDRVRRRRGKQLAHHLDPDTTEVDRLARTLPYPALSDASARATQIERIATDATGGTVDHLLDQLDRAERLTRHVAPGVRVKAMDRHNIGTILRTNPIDQTARVRFTSADGREAVKTLQWDSISIVDPDVSPSPIHPAAQVWLDQISDRVDSAVQDWNTTVTRLGSTPDAARIYGKAADLVLDRAVNDLAARQPEWLTNLIGPRPEIPEGATAWRSALTDITRHRLASGIEPSTPGLGLPTADNGNDWLTLHRHVANTRQWLAEHPDYATPEWPIRPSEQTLLNRQIVVDAILDTAPPDQRKTITKLVAGQLTLDDTRQALDAAAQGQTARQHWILANWPHVVEAAEINIALETADFGPDLDKLTEAIADDTTNSPLLRSAATDQAPWLAAAINRLAAPADTTITTEAIEWLEDVAEYRQTYNLDHRNPLGPKVINTERAHERQQLTERVDNDIWDPAPSMDSPQRNIVNDLIAAELAAIDDPTHDNQVSRHDPGGIELD